jgi:phosphatidylglycerophosphatase A
MKRAHAPRLHAGLLKDPVHLLALGFGSGLSPVAPGTFGTAFALPLAYGLTLLPWAGAAAVVAVLIGSGVWLCGESARRLGTHDHPGIVWDEITAMCLLALLLPEGLLWLGLGFLLFRFFDIAKPWPIRDLDHSLRGGLGIMLDDLAATVYAALALRLIETLTTVI